jgi:hypothetical protein
MQRVETPCKAVKTSEFSTPPTRRRLPWQMDKTETLGTYGLQTPQTGHRTPNNPFAPGLATPQFDPLGTPSRHQSATPSSSAETPTPQRFKNMDEDDLVRDVFGFYKSTAYNSRLPLELILRRYWRSIRGLLKDTREVAKSVERSSLQKRRRLQNLPTG